MNRYYFQVGLRFFLFLQLTSVLLTSCSGQQTKTEQKFPPWYPETNQHGDTVYAVYENKLPCFDEGCTKLKFALAIYQNGKTKLPSTYMMARVYVAKDENGRITNTGNISISNSTISDAIITVYNLTTGAPEDFRHFWKINDSLIFILDNNLQPRVGDASYGYVLNRIR